MDRKDEITSLLAAAKRGCEGDVLPVLTALANDKESSRGFSDETLIYAHLALFSGDPRHLPPAIALAAKIGRRDLLTQMLEIAEGFREVWAAKRVREALGLPPSRPTLFVVPAGRSIYGPARCVDESFLGHCRKHGITVLRQLQVGAVGRESCRSVFLALDADGLVKVFKELRSPETSRLGMIASEREVYERLGPVPGLPDYYGTTEIGEDLSFLRLGVCYGRGLEDFIDSGSPLPPDEARHVVGRLAGTLSRLHAARIVYNDLRPTNVKVYGSQVHLLDVGDAQFLPNGANEVTTYVHGPEHVPPEVVLRHKVSPASDVFQLGIIYHQLLTGKHPFSAGLSSETDYELLRLRDCLANVLLNRDIYPNDLLARMLDPDPERRPSAVEIAKALEVAKSPRCQRRRRVAEPNGTVLFPARIGIPHRGHVDFMARLLELGYDLAVSLNAAYVLSHADPIPKWLVLKMIGRSLELSGFSADRIKFYCTPLFDDDEQIGLHYALMPEAEKIVAVASGNPEVHRLFKDRWPILDQAAIFGREGEQYETRSWGQRLRDAVRRGDRATFDGLIAPGAEEILSFEEMQAFCSRPFLDFAWGRERGRVSVVLRDEAGKESMRRRVSTYSTPEDTLVQALEATFLDRFSRNSLVRVGRRNAILTFEDVTLEGQNVSVHYRLEDQHDDAAKVRVEDAGLQRRGASS